MIIECSKKYFRPSEVDTLLGDPTKAKRELKWRPEIEIKTLVDDMVNEDLITLSNDKKSDKIFLAGHKGLVGSAIYKLLIKQVIKSFSSK